MNIQQLNIQQFEEQYGAKYVNEKDGLYVFKSRDGGYFSTSLRQNERGYYAVHQYDPTSSAKKLNY